jgi:SAM-dependent methyltransferase
MGLAVDYRNMREALKRDRISPMAAADYLGGDDLSGYGDETYDKGGERLEDQQRGLILPALSRRLETLSAGSVVAEIGTGNGDVIAYLAERYPSLSFVGVDLSVDTAQRKHPGRDNIEWRSGYALDLLERGELRADLVFASSTFVVLAPLELRRYVQAMGAAGVRCVVLNEPTWGGYVQDEGAAVSRHLEGAVWFHNFAGYLAEGGYGPVKLKFQPYQHPVSPRPDVKVLLLEAEATPP